jgi:hypothetical protein
LAPDELTDRIGKATAQDSQDHTTAAVEEEVVQAVQAVLQSAEERRVKAAPSVPLEYRR